VNQKKAKKIRRELGKAVRGARIEIEQQIRSHINTSPFIERVKFAGLVLAGKV
jgi:hypothetical protein